MEVIFFLIVISTAIVGLFSEEFTRMFKRIFSIRGAPLFLPLIFFSFVIESNIIWGWAVLLTIRSHLLSFEAIFAALMPQSLITEYFVRVLILTLLAVLPMLVVGFITRKNPLSNAMFYMDRICACIWLSSVILFVSTI